MTTAASTIIQRAAQVLQDTTAVRWDAAELVRWLNDAQREVVMFRPDSNTRTVTGTLSIGTRQNLNTITETAALAPYKLLDVIRNMAATSLKYAVRQTSRDLLDANTPGWHAEVASIDVSHFTFDPRDNQSFYVYPPASSSAQVEILLSVYPTDVTIPAGGAAFGAVTGNISVSDIYANALLDYILYRAYLKDSEYAGSAQRASGHYQAFGSALGVELRGMAPVEPTAPNNAAPTA
jgi:hypothetical protein